MFYHSSVEELDSVRREIVKTRVVPTAVEHWEKVFKVSFIFLEIILLFFASSAADADAAADDIADTALPLLKLLLL